MIPQEYVEKLKKRLFELEEIKDDVITKGIRLNRLSKSVIYSLIRGDVKKAEEYIEDMKALKKEVGEIVSKYPMFRNKVSINFQEFAEAMIFYSLLTGKEIPTHEDLEIWEEEYLMGLMDVAGELNRKATEELIKGNIEFAKKAKEMLEDLYQKMLYMEFRNFEMRKKVDYISNNINWILEKIFYKSVRDNQRASK